MDIENKWTLYEAEKAKIAKESLTSEEYIQRIRELCDRLEI